MKLIVPLAGSFYLLRGLGRSFSRTRINTTRTENTLRCTKRNNRRNSKTQREKKEIEKEQRHASKPRASPIPTLSNATMFAETFARVSPSVQTAERALERYIFFPQFSKVIVTPQKPFDEEQLYFGRTKVDNNSSSSEKNDAHSRHALSRARFVRDDHRVRFSSARQIEIGKRGKGKTPRIPHSREENAFRSAPRASRVFPSLNSLSLSLRSETRENIKRRARTNRVELVARALAVVRLCLCDGAYLLFLKTRALGE